MKRAEIRLLPHSPAEYGTQSANTVANMPEVIELSDSDFAAQMHGLVCEAERALGDRKAPGKAPETEAAAPESAPATGAPSFAEALRPLTQAVQAVGRAAGEHTQILSRLDKAAGTSGAEKELPQVVTDLKAMVEQRNVVSRQMFDALHEELKSYKDGFLTITLPKRPSPGPQTTHIRVKG